MLPVNRNVGALPRFTYVDEPFKDRPVPFLLATQAGLPTKVPVIPLPEESAVVVPIPSESAYPATMPVAACVAAAPSMLPAATTQSKFVSQGERLVTSGAAAACIVVGADTANNGRPRHVASNEFKQATNFLVFKMDAHFLLV